VEGGEVEIATGEKVEVFHEKMSKSKHNGVEPRAVMREWGADTIRLFILFKAPATQVLEWDTQAIQGQHRWLARVWELVGETCRAAGGARGVEETGEERKLRAGVHTAIERVTHDLFESHSFNTAIAELMKLSNALQGSDADKATPAWQEGVCSLVQMLAPLAPYTAAEMWNRLEPVHGDSRNVHASAWPVMDEAAAVLEESTVVIQIQGKKRGTVQIPTALLEDKGEVERVAIASQLLEKYAGGGRLSKTIVANGNKLVNFVLEKPP